MIVAETLLKEKIGYMLAAALIFLGTYLVLAVGRLPGFRVDRTGAAIIGAGLMIAFNVLTLEEAYASIDHNTIMLLFGMMIVVANLRLSGFFAAVAERAVRHAHHRLSLLAAIVAVSGVFSAFFVNDTMCLVLTPMVIEIVLALGRNPVPYLLAVAMSSNIGSVATITGNPQNMMIGIFSGIHYRHFAAELAPVGAVGLLVAFGMIALIYRKEFGDSEAVVLECRRVRVNRVLM
ncbi:MAG: Citrate transporter, partial [Acidobacteria bacterium]|nr:Citrate transporter [Acidobacteriota bacterium]